MQSNKKNFRGGSCDSFFFPKLPYLGTLTQLRVYLHPKGIGSDWSLRSVAVTHKQSNDTWWFYHEGRLNSSSNYEAVLAPMSADPRLALPTASAVPPIGATTPNAPPASSAAQTDHAEG